MNSFNLNVSLPNSWILHNLKKCVCKYIKISNWNYAQSIFLDSFDGRDYLRILWFGLIELDHSKTTFASIKNFPPPKKKNLKVIVSQCDQIGQKVYKISNLNYAQTIFLASFDSQDSKDFMVWLFRARPLQKLHLQV